MKFTVTKTYKPTKDLHPILKAVVFLIALPFIVFTVLVLFLGHLLSQVKRRFGKQSKPSVSTSAAPKAITYLLERENIAIQLIEDDDNEYNTMIDLWYTQVCDEEICPYRAITEPMIAGLSNTFITYFIKETATGAFIQIIDSDKIEHEQVIDTNLIFLNYADLTMEVVGNIGPYLLYIDERKPDLIKGVNYSGSIELLVT